MNTDGEQGEQRGKQGERGRQGLAGEIGKIGLKGNQGNQGNKGNRGVEGRPGEEGSDPTRRLFVLFVLLVFAFSLLAWRTEVNANRIDNAAAAYRQSQAITRYEGCLRGVEIIGKFNTLFAQLAQINRDAIATDTLHDPAVNATRRQYIAIYTDARVTLPANPCGEDPRK